MSGLRVAERVGRMHLGRERFRYAVVDGERYLLDPGPGGDVYRSAMRELVTTGGLPWLKQLGCRSVRYESEARPRCFRLPDGAIAVGVPVWLPLWVAWYVGRAITAGYGPGDAVVARKAAAVIMRLDVDR